VWAPSVGRVGLQQGVQALALTRRQAGLDGAEELAVHGGTHAAGAPVEGAERRELQALDNELLEGDVDQVRRVVHDLGSRLHGLPGHAQCTHGIESHVQEAADALTVPAQGPLGAVGKGDTRAQTQAASNVLHDAGGDILQLREVAEALEGFEEHGQGEQVAVAPGGRGAKLDLLRAGGVDEGQLGGAGVPLESRVGGALDRRHGDGLQDLAAFVGKCRGKTAGVAYNLMSAN
jgi:hypothetical protein